MSGSDRFETVRFETEDGGDIGGSLFPAENEPCVVFAHGKSFNKESWYSVAGRLKKSGIPSLAFDFRGYGSSKPGREPSLLFDVLGAVAFMKRRGCRRIALIGGSMGGAAVLRALENSSDPAVVKVVLLSPAGGPPVRSTSTKKLFVVSEKESFYDTVMSLYEGSAEPKTIRVYTGTSHAQNLFQSTHAGDLLDTITGFLREE
jgi:pimeloyl-ACP methyl ester carboxylesterase